MSDDEINPNFRTKFEDFSGPEKAKLATKGLTFIPPDINSTINLPYQFRDVSSSLSDEAESLAKSYGVYLEFNRAKTGTEKDWMYMLRINIPGGGPITPEQWAILDDLSDRYTTNPEGQPSLRVTTRQNVQFHWVRRKDLIDVVRNIAESGFFTINGCGDNTRNIMGCPISNFSKIYNANALARKFGEFFRLPTASFIEVFQIDPIYLRDPEERFQYGENLLNRKFKIAFSALHYDPKKGKHVPDNCVELRTHDIGIAPLLEDGRVNRFQVYIGGSQGEKNGRPTFSAMGEPLGIFKEKDLLKGLDAIVQIHQEWGDRQRRYWARMKYVLMKQGMEWFRQHVRDEKGIDFDLPNQEYDYGDRSLHRGWVEQESNGLYSCGVYIENGRIIDGQDGKLKKMTRYLMDNYPIILFTTPNQDLLLSNIPVEMRGRFEDDMKRFGYGSRNGRP
ncbi:MAG: nitrite/sulfite reductase, partial [Nitrososphaerales archaeon]